MHNDMDMLQKKIEEAAYDPMCFAGSVLLLLICAMGLWLHDVVIIVIGVVLGVLFCLPALTGNHSKHLVKQWVHAHFNIVGFVLNALGYIALVIGLWNANLMVVVGGALLLATAYIHAGMRKGFFG
ncbi:MAG: hypothetical protein AABW59_00800 [archaeon]